MKTLNPGTNLYQKKKKVLLFLSMLIKEKHTKFIKAAAKNIGFDYCGIAKAHQLDEDARRLESWLNKGFQGSMSYMNNYFDLRIDPAKLVPGAKSVITFPLPRFTSGDTTLQRASGVGPFERLCHRCVEVRDEGP